MMSISIEDCYKSFVGSGNRNGTYWIIGFEPGSCPNFSKFADKDVAIKYINEYRCQEIKGPVLSDVSCIIRMIDSSYIKSKNYKRFIHLPEDGIFFYTNLYPLNFPNESGGSLASAYRGIFKNFTFSFDRRDIYDKSWIIERYHKNFEPYLNSPKIIFILKKNYDEEFQTLLGLNNIWGEQVITPIIHGNSSYQVFKNYHTIILLKNGRIGEQKIKEVLIEAGIVK